jgi:hypothetical protein
VLVAAYWGVLLLCDRLELTTFARFISRLAAGSLLILALLVWWWVNRRIRPWDRAYGFAVVFGLGAVASPFCAPSIGGFGLLMGPLAFVLTVWVLWMVLAKKASPVVQRLGLFLVVSAAWVLVTLVRMEGLSGDLHPAIRWRWLPTAEDRFLATRGRTAGEAEPAPAGAPALTLAPGDWPGFRGPDRDGTVRGARIRTDWKANPPREVWRQLVGPAWSSLVVVGDRLFTQEQRGDHEAVVCYDAGTGKELWAYEDEVRFWEPTAEAGPRASPCFARGRLFAVGAKGKLNCLDAVTGKPKWSHDLTADAGARVPPWGYSCSPLVLGDLVIVFAGGESSRQVLAYRIESGELAWTAPAGECSYSSPQPATLAGQEQVLVFSNTGLTALDPADGAVLWKHEVPLPASAPRSIQPHVLGQDQVLIASEADLGLALIDVKREGRTWTVTQRWVSKALKPAFNDFVVHEGHAYGFDGRIFACVELKTGEGCWKEGRYGQGQVVLLPEQGLLVVTSETGQAVLLRASPERHEVLGRLQVVKGKTWNHPVIAHGRLYVRNAEEMACYDLDPSRPAGD